MGAGQTYHLPKNRIRTEVVQLLPMSGISVPDKRLWPEVFELYASLNISFPDAYYTVLMRRAGITRVISYDRDFDRVADITRERP